MKGRHKPVHKKNDPDTRQRSEFRLELDDPDLGCQLFRGKLLCRGPVFVVVEGPLGKVGICIECWARAIDIATDGDVNTLEIRRRYERGVPLLQIEADPPEDNVSEVGDPRSGQRRVVRCGGDVDRLHVQGHGNRTGAHRKRRAS